MARGYGIRVYILYGHHAISLRAFGNRPVQNCIETLYGNCTVIVQSPEPNIVIARISYTAPAAFVRRPHRDPTVVLQSSCSFVHSCTKHEQFLISD